MNFIKNLEKNIAELHELVDRAKPEHKKGKQQAIQDKIRDKLAKGSVIAWEINENWRKHGNFATSNDAYPPTQLTINSSSQTTGDLLLLKDIPSELKFTAPSDLLFTDVSFIFQGKVLDRNMALPLWGSGGKKGNKIVYNFPQPTRLNAIEISVLSTIIQSAPGELKITGLLNNEIIDTAHFSLKIHKGKALQKTFPCDFQDIDRLEILISSLTQKSSDHLTTALFIHSASSASQLAIGLAGDPTLQIFQPVLKPGVKVNSRPLTQEFNQAWQRGKKRQPEAENLEISLELLAKDDGLIEYTADIVAQRFGRGFTPDGETTINLNLNSWQPITCQLKMPSIPLDRQKAKIWLNLTGKLQNSRRLGIMNNPEHRHTDQLFQVMLDESLEIAQPLQINDNQAYPQAARELTALWLCVPDIPAEPQNIHIRLHQEKDSQPGPEIIGEDQFVLPVDGGKYLKLPSLPGLWYRAELSQQININAKQLDKLLYLAILSPQATLLCGTYAQGKTHTSLLKFYDSQQWQRRKFSNHLCFLCLDMEIKPLENEQQITINNQTIQLPDGKAKKLPVSLAMPNNGQITITSMCGGSFELEAGYQQPWWGD